MLCFAVPGTVAGVSYILAFNDAPIYLTGTAAIVVISMVMRNVRWAFAPVSPDLVSLINHLMKRH